MTILKQMPRLRFLNLSFNELSTPLDNSINAMFKWQHLQNLVLNSTLINWQSVRKLLIWFPELKELHLSKNDYETVDLNVDDIVCDCDDDQCQNCHTHFGIRVLHFNGNLIRSWNEARKLGIVFPNLENLVLADCPIVSLNPDFESDVNYHSANTKRQDSGCECDPQIESPHSNFRNLRILNLNFTLLSHWDEIEALARFPVLQSARVQVHLTLKLRYIILNFFEILF